MKLLLDTQVLIWTLLNPDRLAADDLALVRDRRIDVMFSVASIWEVAIKAALRRQDFDVNPARLVAAARLDFREVTVLSSAAIRVATLPNHHRDPFDRLLIAQAGDEDARLLTSDAALAAYDPAVRQLTPVRARTV